MRKVLWTAAGTLLHVSCAMAQSAGANGQNVSSLEEVIVSGVRQSLEEAVEAKRSAVSVIDAISAEDVGKFPTENVAESLQRVTGVQITRFRGEGQNVTIRGLPTDFTLVQLNGRTLTSALGPSSQGISRSFDFTILPSEFVSRLEVLKSPTADVEEGGLSGTVIARTVRPLDIGEFKLAGNLQYAEESNRGEATPRASALYADTFAEGKLGVALGVAYTERKMETHEQRVTRYRRLSEQGANGLDVNGNGTVERTDPTRYATLDSIFQGIFREDRERETAIGTLQFKPNDRWDFIAESFYSKLDLVALSYSDLLRVGVALNSAGSTRAVPGSLVINPHPGNASAVGDAGQPIQTVEAGRYQGVDQRGDGRVEIRDGDLRSFSLGGTYHGDTWDASLEVGYSAARQTRSNPLLENTRSADLIYDLRPDSDFVSYSFGGNDNVARLDPSTYRLLSFNGEWDRHRKDEQTDVSLDFNKDLEWGWLDGLKFGGRYAERSVYEDARRINASPTQLMPLWNGGAPNLFLVEVSPSRGRYLGAAGDTSSLVPQSWLVNDPMAFIRAYGRERIESLSTFTNDAANITDVTEETSALYLRADLIRPGGIFSGNIGLRAVRTDQASVGISPDLNGITFFPGTADSTRIPAARPLTVDRTYTDFLPSLNLKLDLTDDLVVRFAAARTMARPTLTSISPTISANAGNRSITANNPELDPFRANNFDLSGEWYFGRGALLATTLFYKDIVSSIVPLQTSMPLTITQINLDGSQSRITQDWVLSTLVNRGGSAVSGVEFAYQQNFDFLPAPFDGFGFLGNYTYLENHGSQRLQGASRNNYTTSIYYEKGWFGTRLTYTYRDDFYSATDGATQDDRIEQAYGTLDGTLTVNFNDRFSAVLEATNILDKASRIRYMPIDLYAFNTDFGRRVLLGVRASF